MIAFAVGISADVKVNEFDRFSDFTGPSSFTPRTVEAVISSLFLTIEGEVVEAFEGLFDDAKNPNSPDLRGGSFERSLRR